MRDAFSHAQSFIYPAAKATTRGGRPSVGAKEKPLAIRVPIYLVPGNAFALRDEEGPVKLRMERSKDKDSLATFFHDQGCIMETKLCGWTTATSASEIQKKIHEHFEAKGFPITKYSWEFGRILEGDPHHELIRAPFQKAQADGKLLKDMYGGASGRCYIVMMSPGWPKQFQDYFGFREKFPEKPSALKEVDPLQECDWCLCTLPESLLKKHVVVCDRKLKGFDPIPRLIGLHLGGHRTAINGDPVDWKEIRATMKDISGVFWPETDPCLFGTDSKDLSGYVPVEHGTDGWCICRGVGQRLTNQELIECHNKNKCPVRWYHNVCLNATGSEDHDESGWICFMCKVIASHPLRPRTTQGRIHGANIITEQGSSLARSTCAFRYGKPPAKKRKPDEDSEADSVDASEDETNLT
ncbi:hypothetical protein OC861_002808 [Tilletia horrida]|nr:hypothetical protein OC861_002808 [Tilletia horrida]